MPKPKPNDAPPALSQPRPKRTPPRAPASIPWPTFNIVIDPAFIYNLIKGAGSIQNNDGTTSLSDGGVVDAEKTSVTRPDGITQYDDGTVKYPDGTIVFASGETQYPDGSVLYPDGDWLDKEGHKLN